MRIQGIPRAWDFSLGSPLSFPWQLKAKEAWMVGGPHDEGMYHCKGEADDVHAHHGKTGGVHS